MTSGIYTVYEAGKAYARASIVVGDDGSVSDRYAYLYDEPNYEKYNKAEDVYYWNMDAVIDGVKTTVTFKSDLPFKDTVLSTMGVEGDMFKLSYDKDGYAVDAKALKANDDYHWLYQYATMKPDDVNILKNDPTTGNLDLECKGDTLWITNQAQLRGYALADNCPAVIVEMKKDSKGNWGIDETVEYTSVEKAIKALDNEGKAANFGGTIYLVFKDGIVSSVVMTDKVVKDDHKKEDTVAGITASLKTSADGKGLTLRVTGMTATDKVSYKVVATDIRSQNSAVVKSGDISDEYTKVVDVTDSTMSYAVEVTVNGKTMTVSL